MGKRHEAIAIKQVIRFEWMEKATNLLLAGLDARDVRHELHEFLSCRKGSGSNGGRGETSKAQVVNMLMKIWVSPAPELQAFRDALLSFIHVHPSMSLPIHWGMISATYPFWFNVARQVGRLLSLQDQVTQAQVFTRLNEQYGERETVARYSRYTIRSFVAWGVLADSEAKGCYEKTPPLSIADINLAILMFESALLAAPEAKGALGLLVNNPAFFPFQFPVMSGDFVSQRSKRIEVVRYGLNDELLALRGS